MKKIVLKENLNTLMEHERCNQIFLVKKLSINKSTLHNYLNGAIPQGLTVLIKLSEHFNLSLDELIFGSNPLISANKDDPLETEHRYEVTIKQST